MEARTRLDTVSLVLALHEEHRQRTGHDCTDAHRWPLYIGCMVCQHLRGLMRQVEALAATPTRED